MPRISQDLKEHAVGMLIAGLSTETLPVNGIFVERFNKRFGEFGIRPNRPQNHWRCVPTPAQDHRIQHVHL